MDNTSLLPKSIIAFNVSKMKFEIVPVYSISPRKKCSKCYNHKLYRYYWREIVFDNNRNEYYGVVFILSICPKCGDIKAYAIDIIYTNTNNRHKAIEYIDKIFYSKYA